MLLTSPDLGISSRSDYWVVRTPILGRTPNGAPFTIPVGFESDLASIPRLIRGVLDVNGESREPALEHDWSYTKGFITREQADENLRLNLIACGMSASEARVYWLGVRAGGWKPWNEHRAKGITVTDFDTEYNYNVWKGFSAPWKSRRGLS